MASFCQEFVATDNSRKEGSDGTVHPLCASVMAYLKKLLKHNNFLRVLFRITDKDGGAQFSVGNPMSTALVNVLMVLQACVILLQGLAIDTKDFCVVVHLTN